MVGAAILAVFAAFAPVDDAAVVGHNWAAANVDAHDDVVFIGQATGANRAPGIKKGHKKAPVGALGIVHGLDVTEGLVIDGNLVAVAGFTVGMAAVANTVAGFTGIVNTSAAVKHGGHNRIAIARSLVAERECMGA